MMWLAVGFMLMTGNTVNDPKVRYKLGEGDAPQDVVMTALHKAYKKMGAALMGISLNGAMFNIELFPKVKIALILLMTKKRQSTLWKIVRSTRRRGIRGLVLLLQSAE